MTSAVRYIIGAGVVLALGAGGWLLYGSFMPKSFDVSHQAYSTSSPVVEQPFAGRSGPENTSTTQIPVETEAFRGQAEPRDTRWPPAAPDKVETPLAASEISRPDSSRPDTSGLAGQHPAEPATPPELPETSQAPAPEKTPTEATSDSSAAVADPVNEMPEQQQGAEPQPKTVPEVPEVKNSDSAVLPSSYTPSGNESITIAPPEASFLSGDASTSDTPETAEKVASQNPEPALPPLLPRLDTEPAPGLKPAPQPSEDIRKIGQEPPVIRYSRGKSVPGDNSVRGKAGNSANVVDTSVLYGSAASRSGQQPGRRAGRAVLPVGQDSVVLFAFVTDMAQLLVQGYWPQGTHPGAVSGSISTVTVKGLNTRYGVSLQGLGTDGGRLNHARTRILEYVLRPSMVEGLYGLYAERFILAVREEAGRERFLEGGQTSTLSTMHKISMFTLYADMLKGMSAGIRSYLASPDIATNINEYIVLEQKTLDASRHYAEAKNQHLSGTPRVHSAEKQYHAMVAKREQAKMRVASAMRASHSRWEMDADSLVYLATWLHRRPPSMHEGLQILANCFDKLSLRMREEASILQGGE